MNQFLAQRILDIVYGDPHVRRAHKDSIADWILDTQPWSTPLSTSALLTYLAAHHADVLERLMSNVRIGEDLAFAVRMADPGGCAYPDTVRR